MMKVPILRVALLAAVLLTACGGGEQGAYRYPIALDPSWANAGIASFDAGVGEKAYVHQFRVSATAVDQDGRVVVVGERYTAINAVWMIRFGPTGQRDMTCGSNGWFTRSEQLGPAVPHLVRQMPDGRYLIAGRMPHASILVLKPDCTVDTTFGVQGVATLPGLFNVPIVGAHVGADGRITVVVDMTGAGSRLAVGRFLPDGSPDPSFGVGGVAQLDEPDGGGVYPGGIAVRPDGRILVGASFDYSLQSGMWAGFIQLLPDGRLDTSFGERGAFSRRLRNATGNNLYSMAAGMVLLPDGSAVLIGYTRPGYISGALRDDDTFWWKVSAAGAPVTSFGDGGQVVWSAGPPNVLGGNYPAATALTPDGALLWTCMNWTNNTGRSVADLLLQAIAVRIDTSTGALVGSPSEVGRAEWNVAYCKGLSMAADGRPVVGLDFGHMVRAGAVARLAP
jgi:uncharacterized delta-60 repeat protein